MKSPLKVLKPVQIIVLLYVIAAFVAFVLFSMPITHKPGVELAPLDALFTAVSAISVTGLSVVSIVDTFNPLGVIILACVMQLGGIGIMTLGTFVWLVMKRRIGFKGRQLIMADQNQLDLNGLVTLMRQIITIIVSIEIIGSIILGFHYLGYFETWQESFYQGFFAAVSATTNSGFDITGSSLVPFKDDYFVQSIVMILVILGAIGFPVLIEMKNYLAHRGIARYRFSLYTKLTTTIFFLLAIIGFVSILLLEMNNFFVGKSWDEKIFYSLFQSITTRNAGLATMDVNEFTQPTLLIMSILMFIGASPSSVGGGVRTTTVALNFLFLYNFAKGNKEIKVFRRELYQEDVLKALVVTMMATILCFCAVVVLMITEHFSLLQITFEVCSAFGTTGLSLGITPDLSSIGKFVIIILMFIGRIGILSFLLMMGGKGQKEKYRYPKERIIIG